MAVWRWWLCSVVVGVTVCATAGLAAAQSIRATTIRVSVSSRGMAGNDFSGGEAVSATGRYTAFCSDATNLVAGDTNGTMDIFVRDRFTGTTTRADVSSRGAQSNGWSCDVGISADGRFVVFSSDATNLVSGDTNGAIDVFVRDRRTGTTSRADLSSAGEQAADGDGARATAISANGRFVTFYSPAANLVPGDTNGRYDTFVRDLRTGTTTRADVSSAGKQANGDSQQSAISADGRYVAFTSSASNLTPHDTTHPGGVFVRDRKAGTTTLVSVPSSASSPQQGGGGEPAISADGHYVAFDSDATDLVPGDTNGTSDVFVRDLRAGTTSRVSLSSGGAQGNAESLFPSISADGRCVAFASSASDLVRGDTNFSADAFVRDRLTGRTIRVSVSASGKQADPATDQDIPAISADGRHIAFSSSAPNLVPADTNDVADVFVRDLG